jgi:PKD repeat protein
MILWRRISRGLLFLILLGFLGLALQAGTNISRSSDTESWGPRVTVDPSGNVHAVWLEKYSDTSGDIYYSKLNKSGGYWTTPQNISQSERCHTNIKDSYHEADIDHDASGNIYVVWAESPQVKLRILTSGGSWGSVFDVASTNGLDGPIMSVSGGGDIYITWYSGYRIWGRTRINGQWEATKQISTGSAACKYPHIAVGGGVVYAVWMQKTSADYRIFWTKRNATLNAAWAAQVVVYNGKVPQCYPSVKVDPSGVAHCVYLDEQAEGVRTAMYSVKSGSGFSSPTTISATSGLHYPSMSIQSTNVYAQWQSGGWGNGTAIRYNMKLSGSWAGERSVPDSKGCTYGDIEADSNGDVHFVYDSYGECYYYSTAGGVVPPPPPPPPPPVNKAPTANFTFSPSSGWAPQEVEFDGGLSIDPDGAVVSWSWQFGDGGQGSGSNLFHAYLSRGSYTIKLTVTDNSGASASKTKPIKIEGIYPPKDIQWSYNVDRSLFSERWVAKITWSGNSLNDSSGYSIDHYDVYRQEVGAENDAWKIIKTISASMPLEYMDTDVKSEYQYNYGVRAVDNATPAHQSSIATQGTSETPPAPSAATARVNVRPPIKR